MKDNDTVRRVVEQEDRNIHTLRILMEQHPDIPELLFAVQRLEEARFWLKAIGHGSHFDSPEGEPE